MRLGVRVVGVWLLLLVGLVRADGKADLERIISVGREGNRVMEHLDFLTNRFGPRLTGSDNLQNASEWAKETFASLGLANARLEPWGEFPVGFNRGPWFGAMVKPVEKTLHFGTNAWSAGTRGRTRGPAVLAPENVEQLEKAKPRLTGAWVLQRTGRFGARIDPEFQKKLDAAYQEAKVAGFIRGVAGELIHTGGNPRISWDKLPTTPQINLLKKEWDELAERLAKGEDVVLEFDIRNYFKKGPIKLYNVIADLPGSDLADEYVIVGGHIDSWDGATGAMDNGTGCAVVIEAARILAKAGVKPRRTIRFMLWSGEEQGLLGSMAYVRANPELMKKISAVLVDDGGTNYVSGIMATEAMVSDIEQVFAPVKDLDPKMPFAVRKVAGLPPMIGSDQDSFLRANVPGFYLMQAGRANYNHIHHTQFDTFEGAIPEYQEHSSIVVAVGAYGIANLDHMLSREKLMAAGGFAFRPSGRVMGVQLGDGLKIEAVLDDTAAAKAGFKPGDVILKVDGKKVANQEELRAEIQKGEPNKKVTLQRDGKEIDFVLEWSPPRKE
jgi:hypothetical protein